MTYPDTPGFQAHSETSKEAAACVDAKAQRRKILEIIYLAGKDGKTNDEISAHFGKTGSYYSPRLIELERSSAIIKTMMTRKTRAGRVANVYVYHGFYDLLMGQERKKPEINCDIMKLVTEHKRMKAALERIADGDFLGTGEVIYIARKGLENA